MSVKLLVGCANIGLSGMPLKRQMSDDCPSKRRLPFETHQVSFYNDLATLPSGIAIEQV